MHNITMNHRIEPSFGNVILMIFAFQSLLYASWSTRELRICMRTLFCLLCGLCYRSLVANYRRIFSFSGPQAPSKMYSRRSLAI